MEIIFSILAVGGLGLALVFFAKAITYTSISILNAIIQGAIAFWNFRKYSLPIFAIISFLLIPFYLILPHDALPFLVSIHFILGFLIANIFWYILQKRIQSLVDQN